MAKQTEGYMGGFSGRLGPAVGYLWRGKWCLRSHNPHPRNPRTERQTLHREMFKREVQLAASMRWAVNLGLRDEAYRLGMTSYNLFVHLNQAAFGIEERRTATEEGGEVTESFFRVDYSRLRLCTGQLAKPLFDSPELVDGNTVRVRFGRGDGEMRCGNFDSVYLYAYCPDLGKGYLAAPVYRNARRVAVALPDIFEGCEVHLYGMACNEAGEWCETVYVGCVGGTETEAEASPLPGADGEAVEPETVDGGGHEGVTSHRAVPGFPNSDRETEFG